jgi:hypothetical protein
MQDNLVEIAIGPVEESAPSRDDLCWGTHQP